VCGLTLAGLLAFSGPALASTDTAAVPLSALSVLPFALLLVCIAVVPLVAAHWWHSHVNKALVAMLFAVPVAAYLLYLGEETQGASIRALAHELQQYISFIVLLAALYTISGGIVVTGDIRATPMVNTLFLAAGAVLANLIGTTGASMLLIRPLLQTNSERRNTRHTPVFFIFVVSNLGGVLTPLGDPPLFLGFLNGVDFDWTLRLWPQWLTANGLVLAVFFVWDSLAFHREKERDLLLDRVLMTPLRLRGKINLLFLVGVLLAVVLQSPRLAHALRSYLPEWHYCPDLTLTWPWAELIMVVMAILSWFLTPRSLREANAFTWSAIIEVAVLFLGIFVTMVPALEVLKQNGHSMHLTEPWQYFWLTGALSSFLDNAPTYMTFATLAAGQGDFRQLMHDAPLLLAAVSCGAVFMGANTYIGNGPNFMVKAIAEERGYSMPSFFGYMLYSGAILLPIFFIITIVFF